LNRALLGSTIFLSTLHLEAICLTTNSSCHDCKRLFSKILSLVDYEKGCVVCPKCGSKRVEQHWSAFTVITSKKSA
jgi:RNA polymerase subunit RPABC4/transcription elongation factor Spt4